VLCLTKAGHSQSILVGGFLLLIFHACITFQEAYTM
jgi:hypothetical protein